MRKHAFGVGVCILLALAGTAAGQSPGKPAAEPALQGPRVNDREVPGAAPDFGMGANRRFGERVPPEVFRRALGVLAADDAPAEIRATPALREKIEGMVKEFEGAARKYRQEHAKQIEELRQAAGELPERARRPGAQRAANRQQEQREDEMMASKDLTPEQQKARDQARASLRELLAGAPKIEDVYTKVWTELSEPQRKAVQKELDEWREEQAQKREDEYVRRQTGGTDKSSPEAPPPSARPRAATGGESSAGDGGIMAAEEKTADRRGPAERQTAARRERLMRLFSQMTAEEQDQLLQRLEERFKERRRTGGRAERPAGKAPADPDRVRVPNPESDKK